MSGSILGDGADALDRARPRKAGRNALRPDCRQRRLSHELGTPLNAILGNVGLMLDGSTGPLSRQARDCLAEIQSAGHDLLRQSRMLLLLVQALEAHEPADAEVAPVARLFEDALRRAQLATGSNGLTMTAATANARIIGDPFWLQTLARCIVDAYAAGDGRGPLRIEIETPARLRIDWPKFRRTAIPATAVGLIRRIVELHGGRMLATTTDAFVLSWPGARLLLPGDLKPGEA